MTPLGTPRIAAHPSRGRTWLQRIALTLIGLGIVALAFFFLAVALVVGAVLAGVIAVRWWWLMRRLKASRKAAGPLEGQYSVIQEVDEPRR